MLVFVTARVQSQSSDICSPRFRMTDKTGQARDHLSWGALSKQVVPAKEIHGCSLLGLLFTVVVSAAVGVAGWLWPFYKMVSINSVHYTS